VLFISHNMGAIQSLCSRAILFDSGHLIEDSDAEVVVRHYLDQGNTGTGERVWQDQTHAPGSNTVRLFAVRVVSSGGNYTSEIPSNEEFSIELEYQVIESAAVFSAGIHLLNKEGIQIFTTIDTTDPVWNGKPRPAGRYKSICHIPADLLAPGQYNATVQIKTMSPPIIHLREQGAIVFNINDKASERDGIFREFRGVIRPLFKWESRCEDTER
jgi:lipopolysaccharide transport system ATP-binding protein